MLFFKHVLKKFVLLQQNWTNASGSLGLGLFTVSVGCPGPVQRYLDLGCPTFHAVSRTLCCAGALSRPRCVHGGTALSCGTRAVHGTFLCVLRARWKKNLLQKAGPKLFLKQKVLGHQLLWKIRGLYEDLLKLLTATKVEDVMISSSFECPSLELS